MAAYKGTVNISLKSVRDIFFVKLKRGFSLKDAYSAGFLLDSVLKLGSISVESSVFGFSDQKLLKLRPLGSRGVSDYIFFFSMFKILFSSSSSRTLSPFLLKDIRSVSSGDKVISKLKINILNDLSFFNFFYFISFYYVPRLISMGSGITGFSVSAIFPDFLAYSQYFSKFSFLYPHYSVVMKRAGLFIFLDDFKIKFNFNVSSYVLKSSYVSYAQSEDWNLKFAAYYSLEKKDPHLVDFFRLQKSYFKFFVVGKNTI